MNRHWLKSYPEGVAHEIDPEQFQSLNKLLEDSATNAQNILNFAMIYQKQMSEKYFGANCVHLPENFLIRALR